MATKLYEFMALTAFAFLLSTLPFGNNANATTVRMTMYADGKSCPGECDAHVVFDKSLNGTQFAHTPGSSHQPYKRCSHGSECEICLESGPSQCIKVTYRGAGPTKNTFDLTPAFYESHCGTPDAPALLQAKCLELESASSALKGRVNCIKNAEHVLCNPVMPKAQSMQSADLVFYEECKKLSEVQFNRGRPLFQQRSNNCAYEFKGTGGPNSKGVTWKKLLPGACRAGTYVGQNGLDCCSGSLFADGALYQECKAFYPKP
jgi:hypothetical protein